MSKHKPKTFKEYQIYFNQYFRDYNAEGEKFYYEINDFEEAVNPRKRLDVSYPPMKCIKELREWKSAHPSASYRQVIKKTEELQKIHLSSLPTYERICALLKSDYYNQNFQGAGAKLLKVEIKNLREEIENFSSRKKNKAALKDNKAILKMMKSLLSKLEDLDEFKTSVKEKRQELMRLEQIERAKEKAEEPVNLIPQKSVEAKQIHSEDIKGKGKVVEPVVTSNDMFSRRETVLKAISAGVELKARVGKEEIIEESEIQEELQSSATISVC